MPVQIPHAAVESPVDVCAERNEEPAAGVNVVEDRRVDENQVREDRPRESDPRGPSLAPDGGLRQELAEEPQGDRRNGRRGPKSQPLH